MPRQKFSDKSLHALKAPANGQVDHWDTLLSGFGIRVGHGGKKTFQVGTRVNGRYRRFTLKPAFPQLSLADARAQAAKIIADAQRGIDPTEAKAEEKRQLALKRANTFAAVAHDYMIDHCQHLRTRDELQRCLDVDVLPVLGDRPIASIKRTDLKALLREKARTAPISSNRLAALLSSIFAWALDEEIVAGTPATRLPRYGQEKERERSLAPDEIRILWNAFDRCGYPFGTVLKMLLVTGQRRGELVGIKWSEIDGDAWMLPGERSKMGKGHRVPLSTLAREILDGIPHVGEYIFTARGDRPVSGFSVAKRVVEALCSEPVKDWRQHDLRRTCATQMRTIGIDRLVVSKILNHAEGGITRIYDRYAADPEQAAAMERWANRLRQIIGGEPMDNVVQLRSPA
jgi:integrase